MAKFTFVNLSNSDPKSSSQPRSIRKVVRSQAARAAGLQRGADDRKSKDAIGLAHYRAKKHELDRRPIVLLTRGPQAEPAEQASRTPSDSDRSSSARSPSMETSSQSSDEISLLVEPLHPMLVFQPLLAERFSPLLTNFYLKCMAVDIPDLDLERPGSLRSLWFPFAILHDGLLQIIFLLAGSCYMNERTADPNILDAFKVCLVKLKQQALYNIRKMMLDPHAHNSDQCIAAVTKLASYEAMYGMSDVFAIHMRALRKLVDSRGGLSNLGLDGLLPRMVSWVDYNAACLLNAPAYFPESNALPKPLAFDPSLFIGGSE